MNVLRPSTNIQTGNPTTHGYPAYDFDDKPNLNAYAPLSGRVIRSYNSENRHWVANKPGDPWYVQGKVRALKDADYGNFALVDSGNGITYLLAHMAPGTVTRTGTQITTGDVIGIIGFTGNCTGSHLHFEIRINGVRQKATFTNNSSQGGDDMTNEEVIRAIYRGMGIKDTPENDWVKQKLQSGITPEKLIREINIGNQQRYYRDLHDGFKDSSEVNSWINQKINSGVSFLKLVQEMLAGRDERMQPIFKQIKDLANKL